MARTDTLGHFLTDVADAIRTKSGTSAAIQASTFDTAITNIPSGTKYAPAFVSFYNYPGTDLSSLINSSIDFKNITSTFNMFGVLSPNHTVNVTTIDVSQIASQATGITDMQNMFYNRRKLTTITGINNINTSAVTTMNNTFRECYALPTLDLSNWTTTNVTDMSYMFHYCTSLTHIDMRNFTFTSVGTYNNMFGAAASTGVPNDCEIIVKDNDAKTWITGKFSRLTNVKTVAEYEAE